MRRASSEARDAGKTIGFVPTMGYLHEGHLSLVDRARAESDLVVVSVFVNPLQFGPREDFKRYPRDISRDRALARARGCDILFHPSAEDFYPEGFCTSVRVKELDNKLCGKSRPGHFEGVCTVVMKLLNVVRPHRVYLGQKDAQQAIILARMIRDMEMDVKVRVCPIVRERDGLAMSSRNVYLSPRQREQAPGLYRALKAGAHAVAGGETDPAAVRRAMIAELRRYPLVKLDYLEVVDPSNLETPRRLEGRTLLAGAVWLGKTRLIDNLVVTARGKRPDRR
jgi:pantoate--beta-alanine ligase